MSAYVIADTLYAVQCHACLWSAPHVGSPVMAEAIAAAHNRAHHDPDAAHDAWVDPESNIPSDWDAEDA